MAPDRSKEFKTDAKGISYSEGNRHSRRMKAAGKKTRTKTKERKGPVKSVKLPKKLWAKGKSKFAFPRLNSEGVKSISELY